MEQIKLKDLEDKQKVDLYLLIDTVDKKKTKGGNDYLTFTFKDKSSKVLANYWNIPDNIFTGYKPNDIVRVLGEAQSYQGKIQISIASIELAKDNVSVSISDFVKSAPYPSEVMYDAIMQYIGQVKNEDLKKITTAIYSDYRDQLLVYPAAISFHHAEIGGLLHHTVNMVRNANAITKVYTFLNSDLLICGAALHDIGKIQENVQNEFGLLKEHSVDGELVGHIVRGASIIIEYGNKLDVDKEVVTLLTHMILSHHGKMEYGSPVVPKFPEAEVLHMVDDLDAKMYEMEEVLGRTESGSLSEKVFAFDNSRLYRSDLFTIGDAFK